MSSWQHKYTYETLPYYVFKKWREHCVLFHNRNFLKSFHLENYLAGNISGITWVTKVRCCLRVFRLSACVGPVLDFGGA